MKKVVIIIIGLYLTLFSSSCRKKDKDDCPYCPKIDELVPSAGKKNDTIIIKGKNFSTVLTENIVTFNGVVVPASNMVSGTTTQLKVLVPAKCGTGAVNVKLDDELYSENGPVFTYTPETIITVFAGSTTGGNTGSGTTLANTRFNKPSQVAVDNSNNIYVLDAGNQKVVKLDISTGLSTVLFDNSSQVSNPTAITLDENNILYASSYSTSGSKSTVYKYTPGSAFPTIYFTDFDIGKKHVSLSSDGVGKFFIGRITQNLSIELPDINYFSPSTGNQAFVNNAGNVIHYKNGFVYQINSIMDKMIYQTQFTKFNVKDTVETTLINASGGLNMSKGLTVDNDGSVYISDTENNRILKYNTAGVITVLVSTGLKKPQGIVIDKIGNLYVADTDNNCIKKIIFD